MCTANWETLFPECILQSQATDISDHCPLLLGLNEGTTAKKRFHFESFWPKLDGFHDAVENSWVQPVTSTCPLERISLKLKRLTRTLQSQDEDWLKCEAKRQCLVLASLERTIARLRSCIRFLKDGDANTSLFHRHAAFRKQKNFIPKLLNRDQVVTDQEEKQDILYNYFDELLGTAFLELPRLIFLSFIEKVLI